MFVMMNLMLSAGENSIYANVGFSSLHHEWDKVSEDVYNLTREMFGLLFWR